jgi:hypothetical protein
VGAIDHAKGGAGGAGGERYGVAGQNGFPGPVVP